jgi:ribose transport system substrate-binding protein
MGLRKSVCSGAAIVAVATAGLVAFGGPGAAASVNAHSAGQASVSAAKAAIAPYTGHPTPVPVSIPLPHKLPAGTKFAYLQCVTPVCGIYATLLGDAVHEIGGQLTVVKAGASTEQLQSAFASILSGKPGAIILAGIEPDSVRSQLQQAVASHIPVVSVGIVNSAKYHISAADFGTAQAELAGKLMADWVVANKGSKANVAFYTTPELAFVGYIQSAFKAELGRLCPKCTMRTVDVSVTTFGSTAPETIVSDLQAHPSTNTAVVGVYEAAEGLPAAMQSAGLKETILGFAPTPQNLQDIKSGGLSEGLAYSLPVSAFTLVDEASRLIEHAPLPAGERAGDVSWQFLAKQNLNFNVSQGWAGFTNFATTFAKLWKVG